MLAAVGQICSTNNVSRNAALCTSLIRRAAAARCSLLYLPEAADFIADAKEVPKLSESLDSSEFVRKVRAQAKESAIFVGVGVHEKATEARCYNTSLVRLSFLLVLTTVERPSSGQACCGEGEGPRKLTLFSCPQLISPDGEILQAYRKLHLFDVKPTGPAGGVMLESKTTIKGDKLLDPVETPIGKGASSSPSLCSTQSSARADPRSPSCSQSAS